MVAARSLETIERWDQALQIGSDWWHESAPWLDRPAGVGSYAFGLVASTIVTVGVAGLLLLRHHRRAALYVVLVIAGTTLVTNLLVGLDRLMLGVHTLTEVVAGYALGVGLGLLTTCFYDPSPMDTVVTESGARAARA